MIVKNIHEKLMQSIQIMLIDTKINLPYYGNFSLFVNFHEGNIPTCGVNMTSKGMNFYYSPEFLNKMSQREVNFIMLHEDFHLLWDHPKRTITGQYDHKLSNIAQDMIINHIIWEDIADFFIEIPKDENGRNMALFVPKEYEGKLIFEELYEWLRDKQQEHSKKSKKNGDCKTCGGSGKDQKQKGQGGKENQQGKGEGEKSDNNEPCPDCKGSGSQDGKDSQGNDVYGPYGKDPKNSKSPIDTWSLDQIFDNLENSKGEYLDSHIGDDVPEEMRESMIKEAMERLKSRGLEGGNIEQTLNKLRKKKKDYLKYIKRSLSSVIFGTKKTKTIVKPNRRQIEGLKGHRKIKTKINCILDTSGSMGGTFERVLSYIYRSDIEVNLIEADTNVKWVQNIKSKRKLESIPIKGLGGTVLQPALDYVSDNLNQFNTLVLTDGYTDTLDLSKLKGNVLLISIGVKVPIGRSNNKVKQIVLPKDEK